MGLLSRSEEVAALVRLKVAAGPIRHEIPPEMHWAFAYEMLQRVSCSLALGPKIRNAVRIARIFTTYGPRMCIDDGRVVRNFVAQALRKEPLTVYGDGKQTRSFQYVSDLVVEGLMRLMEGDHIGPFNLGNPGEFTMLELAIQLGQPR
ncbi:UDP-D-glucuronate decarboxylase [Hordeum vulgare]|nr:UDP-D-glucuronate decarboxylase [Hordeum vulgare]